MSIELDKEFFDLFIIVMLVLGTFSVVALGILMKKRQKDNDAQPVRTAHAVLMDKTTPPPGSLYAEIKLVFDVDGGERVILVVSNGERLVVGDGGILTWQGTRLIEFKRDQK